MYLYTLLIRYFLFVFTAKYGEELSKIQKVRVLRNDKREGECHGDIYAILMTTWCWRRTIYIASFIFSYIFFFVEKYEKEEYAIKVTQRKVEIDYVHYLRRKVNLSRVFRIYCGSSRVCFLGGDISG